MVKLIFAVAGGIALVAVMLGIFAGLAMLSHTKPGVPKRWFAWNGYAFFTGRNFEPGAEPARRLLLMCIAAFILGIVIAIAFGLIGWPDPNAASSS